MEATCSAMDFSCSVCVFRASRVRSPTDSVEARRFHHRHVAKPAVIVWAAHIARRASLVGIVHDRLKRVVSPDIAADAAPFSAKE
jgi:hypothetical protein